MKGDVGLRPKDLPLLEKMKLTLPPDVVAEPSKEQLELFISRINEESIELDNRMGFDEGVRSRRTKSAPIPEEYGDDAVLVVIDRDSFETISRGSRKDTARMPLVAEMMSTYPLTRIPPIFLDYDEMINQILLRDGAHRVSFAMDSGQIPFLLAYIKKEDENAVVEAGIIFRKVEAMKS